MLVAARARWIVWRNAADRPVHRAASSGRALVHGLPALFRRGRDHLTSEARIGLLHAADSVKRMSHEKRVDRRSTRTCP
jgi:hypothetical protein